MSFEETLDELKPLKDIRPEICEKIKSHNLPVIIYGAAQTAGRSTDILNSYGVEIAGYAVDEKFYKPNKTYLGRPVYNFAAISTTPEKYVFVLGVNDEARGTNRSGDFIQSKDFIHYEFANNDMAKELNYEYISANREKFAETFNWLADELSKKTMIEFLKLKITYDPKYNVEVYHSSQYFNEVTNGVCTPTSRGGVRGLRRV